jgi:hypothetical protein
MPDVYAEFKTNSRRRPAGEPCQAKAQGVFEAGRLRVARIGEMKAPGPAATAIAGSVSIHGPPVTGGLLGTDFGSDAKAEICAVSNMPVGFSRRPRCSTAKRAKERGDVFRSVERRACDQGFFGPKRSPLEIHLAPRRRLSIRQTVHSLRQLTAGEFGTRSWPTTLSTRACIPTTPLRCLPGRSASRCQIRGWSGRPSAAV